LLGGALVLLALLLAGTSSAQARSGSVDRSFARTGHVVFPHLSGGTSVAVQGNGRILIAGHSGLLRLRSNGRRDASFGRNGLLVVRADGFHLNPEVVTLRHGKILVAGEIAGRAGRVGVARYSSSGRLDQRFGTNGMAVVDVAKATHANLSQSGSTLDLAAVSVAPAGQIVLAGTEDSLAPSEGRQGSDYWLVRLTGSGQPDSTFAAGTTLRIDVGFYDMNPRVTVQSDNRIVLSGLSATCDSGGEEIEQCDRITCGDTVTCTAVLLRYQPSGALDQGFGTPGSPGQTRLISDFDSPVVARQPGGDFTVFIGREIDAGAHRPVVAGLRANGTVSARPRLLGARFNDTHPYAAVRQADGRIAVLLGGEDNHEFQIARAHTDAEARRQLRPLRGSAHRDHRLSR
jgi:uncharacterized delta-60 repeat protein